jgi:hypothetical protein
MLTTLFAGDVDRRNHARARRAFAVVPFALRRGYVLHRWLAIVALAVPVTMLPQIIGAALAVHAQQSPAGRCSADVAAADPPGAARDLCNDARLGTITPSDPRDPGIAAALPLTLGAIQDVLAIAHRKPDGRFLMFDSARSGARVDGARLGDAGLTESGGRSSGIRRTLPGALMAAIGSLSDRVAPAFPRRTKRDIRSWTM